MISKFLLKNGRISSQARTNLARYYTKEELLHSFSQPKLFTKPLTLLSENYALSMNLLKAKYGFKKDYITVVKTGAIIIEFIPLSKDEYGKILFDIVNKKKFLMDLNRIGEVLALPRQINDSFSKEMNYSVFDPKIDSKEFKSVRFMKVANEECVYIRFNCEFNNESITYNYKISLGEFYLMQKQLDYSVPYVIGWHAIASKKLVEDDLNE